MIAAIYARKYQLSPPAAREAGGISVMSSSPEPSRDRIFALAATMTRQDFIALGAVPHKGLKGDEAARLVRVPCAHRVPVVLPGSTVGRVIESTR